MENQWKTETQIIHKQNVPYMAIVFATINVTLFFLTEWIGETTDADFMIRMGANLPALSVQQGECWRWFTSMFLHFGFQHLLNNMVALLAVGYSLECEVGHWKYTLIYIGAGMTGSILSTYIKLHAGEIAVSAGASGAIFGTFGALLWVVIRNKGRYEGMTLKGMLFMIGMLIYYSVSEVSVDNAAHIGGLIMGFALCLVLYRKNKTDN